MSSRSSDEFKDEISEAISWYASKSHGLAERFRRAVNITIAQVIDHPKTYAKFDGEYRRNRVEVFLTESCTELTRLKYSFRRSCTFIEDQDTGRGELK